MTNKGTKIGFAILAHDNIFRLRQILHYLARQNVPIALHIDAKTPQYQREALQFFFKDYRRIYWVESLSCEWGQWSIVEAQIRATKLLLEKEPKLDYVFNLSGSCLPIRPIEELLSFLGAENQQYDYIESVAIGDGQWVYDGLNQERIEFYHPFSWKSQRRLFDLNVKIQKRLKFSRKIPDGLIPSFGSQWWCLTSATLQRIFDDVQFEEYCRFFSKTWIPDESFFQTMARKHSARMKSTTLTYVTFDNMGKPFLLYDDHLPILERLDAFFVRKAWRGADKLYRHFLNPQREAPKRDPFAELELQSLQDYARQTAVNGRAGLFSQFRSPRSKTYLETRAPYYIYVGFHAVRHQIYQHYYGSPAIAQMGYLYNPNRTETELTQHKTPKNSSDLHSFRDYQRLQFLAQRIWTCFPRKLAFLAKPHHLKKMLPGLSNDPNCTIIFVRGAWLLELYERNIENIERLRTVCRIELRRETNFLSAFESASQANVKMVTLGELLTKPKAASQDFPEQLDLKAPEIKLADFQKFLKMLENNGVSLQDYDIDAIMNANKLGEFDKASQVVSLETYLKAKNG